MTDQTPRDRPLSPIAVTLLAAAAFVALIELPIPGLPRESPLRVISIGAVGLTPILQGFIAAELVAVAIGRLQPMRDISAGRARLRLLALTLAILIALYRTHEILGIARPLARFDPQLLLAIFLPLGVVAMMLLARLIDVAGIGAGYSILIATQAAAALALQGFHAVQQVQTELLLRFLLPLGLFSLIGWKMLSWPPYAGNLLSYRLPTPGLLTVDYGVVLAFAALQSRVARRFFWPFLPTAIKHASVYRVVQVLIVVGLSALFSWLFHRAPTAQDRHALRRSARASTLWLLVLTVGTWLVQATAKAANLRGDHLYSLIAIIAVGLDLRAEARVKLRAKRPRVLRELPRLADADALAALLRSAGIECALRGAHHRALYQFFGPFIPVGVLVPGDRFDQADAVALDFDREVRARPAIATQTS